MLRSKQRIVLVEGNPGDAFEAWQQLTEAHHGTVQVDVLPTLAQTLLLLAQGPVDAIVLDLNLPDSRGLATLRKVRAAAGQAAIIVVTGSVDEALHTQARAEGAEAVYDKLDAHSHLFSHSVLYVVERNRARAQHARLQVLLDTLPDAIAIADPAGTLLFVNPAAQALLGPASAQQLGAHIKNNGTVAEGDADADAGHMVLTEPTSEPTTLLLHAGHKQLHCEVRVVPIDWEGQPARLASIKPLPATTAPADHAHAPALAEQGPAAPAEASLRVQQATRLKNELLAKMSLQISDQMQAVSGLSDRLEAAAMEPLQSCYLPKLRQGGPALLSALGTAPVRSPGC